MFVHRAAVAAAAPPLNIVLAIRNDLQRYGIAAMLGSLDIVGHCSAYPELAAAVDAVRDPRTDILLTALTAADAADPGEQAELRRAARLGVRVLLLCPGPDEMDLDQVAELPGASLLPLADLSVVALHDVLTVMDAGEAHLPAGLARALLRRAGHGGPRVPAVPRLTPREKEALILLVDGLSNKQIARRLRISEHGAKRLVANILAKLNCPNRTLAVARALREGLCADRTGAGDRMPRVVPAHRIHAGPALSGAAPASSTLPEGGH
ncbi:response regulator transcription factor [Streptomyces sp. B1866]|uniref:helix-turn-helix transcriptional regulator n=1 Tax=Streptomyces sp. B1866 TaxID=3075431 RepID=UPI00288C6661|nr:response regulator transcription factor [Streptomyces sp. B1866]MDT3398060.1 response regulator transcription factor [Streptomyces sp. B1866]